MPPPPPPPPPKLERSRSTQKKTTVVEIPPERSRSAQKKPTEIPVPSTARQPSIKTEPIPIPINTPQPSRQQSLASTADYRSKSREQKPVVERSRSRNQDIILPIKEETNEPRGRSTKTRSDKIVEQMLASQDNKLIK